MILPIVIYVMLYIPWSMPWQTPSPTGSSLPAIACWHYDQEGGRLHRRLAGRLTPARRSGI